MRVRIYLVSEFSLLYPNANLVSIRPLVHEISCTQVGVPLTRMGFASKTCPHSFSGGTLIGPRRDKTCLRGFQQSENQTSYNFEILLVASLNNTFQNANSKGSDQTARMRRLGCTFVVRKPLKIGFRTSRSN